MANYLVEPTRGKMDSDIVMKLDYLIAMLNNTNFRGKKFSEGLQESAAFQEKL